MISATNVVARAMRAPGTRSPALIARGAAHGVHTVTAPLARILASSSASGTACGRAMSSAPPGSANHAASPVSHRETARPLAIAAAATVRAWLQRSGSSLPAVTFTTRDRDAMLRTLTWTPGWPKARLRRSLATRLAARGRRDLSDLHFRYDWRG